jgi:hypothetical protein
MIQVQAKNRDRKNICPEYLLVQYLLPCFVAAYLKLREEKGVSKVEVQAYQNFVHKLICNYERFPFIDKCDGTIHVSYFYPHSKCQKRVFSNIKQLKEWLQKYIGRRQIVNDILKSLEFLSTSNLQSKNAENNQIESPCWDWIESNWYSFMLLFMERVRHCLEKIARTTISAIDDHIFYTSLLQANHRLRNNARNHFHDKVLDRINLEKCYRKSNGDGQMILMIQATDIISADIPLQRLVALGTYLYMKDLNSQDFDLHEYYKFPLEMTTKICSAIKANDRWKLKILMAPGRSRVEDFSLISYQEAKNKAVFKVAMRALTPRGRVTMESPGEITFCPIKHCRWCGQANVKNFRVCPACKDDPLYPDLNFFCSETCEKQCLEMQHTEEHARYLMISIGMINEMVV